MSDEEKQNLKQQITDSVNQVLGTLLAGDKIAIIVPVVVVSACNITNLVPAKQIEV